jgi:hypothetical protein
MPKIELADMEDVEFLKLLAVMLVNEYDLNKDSPLVLKLVAVTRNLMGAEPVEGLPDADAPTDNTTLVEAIEKLLFKHYIGTCASRRKAQLAAVKVLETVTDFYEAAERAAMLEQQGGRAQ